MFTKIDAIFANIDRFLTSSLIYKEMCEVKESCLPKENAKLHTSVPQKFDDIWCSHELVRATDINTLSNFGQDVDDLHITK